MPVFSLYASLRQCGFEDLTYRHQLEELIQDGYGIAVERFPFVKLNLVHSISTAGFSLGGLSAEAIYRDSLLAAHANPYFVTTHDAYSITHVLFFLTDFARVLPSCFSEADRAYFRSALPRLLEYYLRRQNWDLTSELIVSLKAAGADDSPTYYNAWLLLLASQNEDGSFSGPVGDTLDPTGDFNETDPRESGCSSTVREWNYFYENYHTTLVALLACLVALPLGATGSP